MMTTSGKSLCVLFSLGLSLFLTGQNTNAQVKDKSYEDYVREMNAKFESTKKGYNKKFQSYRDQYNAEFASYMEKTWESINMTRSLPQPVKPQPKPLQTPRRAINLPTTDNTLPHAEIKPVMGETLVHIPIEPLKATTIEPKMVLPDVEDFIIPEESIVVESEKMTMDNPDMKVETMNLPVGENPILLERSKDHAAYIHDKNDYFEFNFYGNTCRVRFPKQREFYLTSSSEKAIAEGWKHLSAENYNDAIIDCVCIRHSLHLCDWAVWKLTQSVTEAYLGDAYSNEAVLMQLYIMTQIGFKVRIAKQDNQLIPLLSYAENLYSLPYVEIDGTRFYNVGKEPAEQLQVCNYVFPGEQPSSIRMKELPLVPITVARNRTLSSEKYPYLKANVTVNANLLEYFNQYPACDYNIKAATSLSETTRNQLYPELKKAIGNKGELEAVNLLLDFVQTGFSYKTDEEQFGKEKSLFAEEIFFYDYSDCEDRAILFSTLVKDLLGLEVVMLDYPSHVATAVKFNKEVKGDHFDIEGARYVICDPTYIGATAGECMPEYKEKEAKISKIYD